MWSDEQKQRFQHLGTRDREQKLTEGEKTELAGMIKELEEEEAAYLRPATERLKQQNTQRAKQNEALKTLVEREKRLNRYLRKVLRKVDSERNAIATELATIIEETSASGSIR
jgi:D-serine dehydratase